MNYHIVVVSCAIALATHSAIAGTQVLGAQLGVTTSDQLRKALSRNTKVSDLGINKYSGGKVLMTDGSSYEIQGLSEVLYIFDAHEKLAGVIMELDKTHFASVYQLLRQKYKVGSERRPFVR